MHDDEGRSIAMNEEDDDPEAGSFRPTYAAVTRGVGVQEDEGHQDGRHARDSESETKGGAMEDSSIMLSIRTPFKQQGSEAALGEYAVETDTCSPSGADGDAYAKMLMMQKARMVSKSKGLQIEASSMKVNEDDTMCSSCEPPIDIAGTATQNRKKRLNCLGRVIT